ncbi:MAG: hypothetical protein ACI8S6_003278 [Myxococcota bacterium]|jgi:hypothetical protein
MRCSLSAVAAIALSGCANDEGYFPCTEYAEEADITVDVDTPTDEPVFTWDRSEADLVDVWRADDGDEDSVWRAGCPWGDQVDNLADAACIPSPVTYGEQTGTSSQSPEELVSGTRYTVYVAGMSASDEPSCGTPHWGETTFTAP